MWLSAQSRVSCWQVWKQMHLCSSLSISTYWWWGEVQQETEKRRCSRSTCDSEKEKVQDCVSQNSDPMSSILRKLENWDWTLRRDTPWNSQDASDTKLKFRKKQDNLEISSKKMKLMSEILWGTNTWGNLTTSRLWSKVAWNLTTKICKF